jgi:predicted DNA-binding antitoxin AbrB/MazE fold protein
MSHDVDAIYDAGVFRPLGPIPLPDGARVHLRVEAENGIAESSAGQRTDLEEFRRVMAALPVESDLCRH